jgi:hypothetical protein
MTFCAALEAPLGPPVMGQRYSVGRVTSAAWLPKQGVHITV